MRPLFFATRTLPPPQQPPSPQQSFPTAAAPAATTPFEPETSRRWTMAANVRRPHRAPPSAAPSPARYRPPRQPHLPRRPMKLASIPHATAALWHRLARIAPYAFSFRRMHAISPLPGNVCPKCMLFEIGMARSSPYASISRCNRVVLDTWRKDLARKVPFSRRETRNHA